MARNKPVAVGTFAERCAALAAVKLAKAARLPPGPEREILERAAWELKTVPQLDNWLSSHDLQPPSKPT
jgi:hypothetical protein